MTDLSPTTAYGGEPLLADIAGYGSEMTAWQLLADIATQLADAPTGALRLGPEDIVIVDGRFQVAPERQPQVSPVYDAPEGPSGPASAAWSLGAAAFYLVMGSHVMNGHGGPAQRAASPLPYMRSSMAELSELVQRCLHYNPAERPSLAEVAAVAKERLKGFPLARKLRADADDRAAAPTPPPTEVWPEKMERNEHYSLTTT